MSVFRAGEEAGFCCFKHGELQLPQRKKATPCFSSGITLHKKARLKVTVKTDTSLTLARQHDRNLNSVFKDAERKKNGALEQIIYFNVTQKVLKQSSFAKIYSWYIFS